MIWHSAHRSPFCMITIDLIALHWQACRYKWWNVSYCNHFPFAALSHLRLNSAEWPNQTRYSAPREKSWKLRIFTAPVPLLNSFFEMLKVDFNFIVHFVQRNLQNLSYRNLLLPWFILDDSFGITWYQMTWFLHVIAGSVTWLLKRRLRKCCSLFMKLSSICKYWTRNEITFIIAYRWEW